MSYEDPTLYNEGFGRIAESCAAWLEGIQRHQIREVEFSALIAGDDFWVTVARRSNGVTDVRFVVDDDVVATRSVAPVSQGAKDPRSSAA